MQKLRKKLSYTRFTVQKLYNGWEKDALFFQGSDDSLADFEGENSSYVLYFWATWCPHCTNVADKMARLESAKIPMIALPFDTARDVWDKEIAENPHWWRDLVRKNADDWDFVERAGAYNVPLIPSVWFVENARVKRVFIGEKGVDKMLLQLEKQGLL